jgi:tryptophan-rich sensory protein
MSLLHAAGLTVLPSIGGYLGSVYSRSGMKNWYEPVLKKPSWRYPHWYYHFLNLKAPSL